MIFKDDVYRLESVGGMGLFAAGYISHTRDRKMDYFLKVVSQKFVSRFTEKSIKNFNKEFPAFRTEPVLDSVREIAGVQCVGTKIIFFNNPVDDYIVWHTDQIALTKSNWCNPFHKIDGVLMEYMIQSNGLVMRLKATEIIHDTIKPHEFRIPVDYKVVSNKTLMRKMEEAFIGFEY